MNWERRLGDGGCVAFKRALTWIVSLFKRGQRRSAVWIGRGSKIVVRADRVVRLGQWDMYIPKMVSVSEAEGGNKPESASSGRERDRDRMWAP